MNKDLIETPRFNFFIGDEVFLKGKIVGFDVDENKCVENVVRLEYGQTLNVPNNDIYITDDIVDKSKIKVTIPKFVADWITHSKNIGRSLFGAMSIFEENTEIKKWMQWAENQETFALAWILGYEVEEEKSYCIVVKHTDRNCLKYDKYERKWYFGIEEISSIVRKYHNRKELEEANFGWVFDCPGVEVEEVEE